MQKAQAAKLSRAQFGLPEGFSDEDDEDDDDDEAAEEGHAANPRTLGDHAEVRSLLHALQLRLVSIAKDSAQELNV